jgi:predicted Zn-dependent peptidase
VDEKLLGTVERLFGDLEARPAQGPEPLAALDGDSPVRLDSKEVDQAHLCLGLRTYPLKHPDRYVVQLLTTILGGGMSSRLTQEVTMRRGLAYTLHAVSHSHTDTGSMWAQGGVNVEKVDDAVATMVSEFRRIADEPVPTDELEKARNYATGRFVFSIETPQGILNQALKREVLEGRVPEPDEVIEALAAVTPEDVQRVAQDLLREGLYLAIVGPYDDPARFEKLLA